MVLYCANNKHFIVLVVVCVERDCVACRYAEWWCRSVGALARQAAAAVDRARRHGRRRRSHRCCRMVIAYHATFNLLSHTIHFFFFAVSLGKLALLQASVVVPQLALLLSAESVEARATSVAALRASIVERSHAVDPFLAALVPNVLLLLKDSGIGVRKATLLFFHYAAHAKPSLVAPHVAAHLDALYGEAKIKPELIREVDLGPFKHKVDDGLELRKAAYECM
jgi:hypothetical protein